MTVTSANSAVNGIDASNAFSIVDNQIQFDPGTLFDALAVGDTASVVVDYTIEDGQESTSSSSLTLTVDGVNDGPVAVADTGSAGENETALFDVLSNDTDVDYNPWVTLTTLGTITVTSANASVNGIDASSAFSISANAYITFDPGTLFDALAVGDTAIVVVDYTIKDGQGAASSSTLTLTVTGANDNSVAVDDTDLGGSTPTPFTSDLQVNTTTADSQRYASIAALEDGGFVVTWSSYNQDGSGSGIYGQRYDAAGNKVGSEFQINTYETQDQVLSSVAGLGDGGFVVTWDSYVGSDYGIYGQRYDATGNKVGSEFQINTYYASTQSFSSVAPLEGGGFVVTWSSYNQDGSGSGIDGQRYDAAGNKVGLEFQINVAIGSQSFPSVAGLDDGGFVVAWSVGSWGDADIAGQRYDASGNKVGSEFATEFQINTYNVQNQTYPSVAALDGGGFVVTWDSYVGSSYGIRGQRYDAAGNKVGSEFQINTYDINDQTFSSVAALDGGGYIVTWSSYGQDGDSYGVYGQRYDAAGNKVGMEFQLNEITTGSQIGESHYGSETTAVLAGGTVVSTWAGQGAEEVYVRLFDLDPDEDSTYSISATTLLANDSDPQGDPLTISSVDGTSAMGAAVTLSGGTITYNPTVSATLQALANGESATDTFSYTISDGNGGADTATVTFTLAGKNDVPVAADDAFSTTEDTVLTIAASGVLDNDSDIDTSDTIAVTEVNGVTANIGNEIALASGALLTLNADGSFSYDPNGSFDTLGIGQNITDSFSYTISDISGAIDTATAEITVNGVNDAPQLVTTALTSQENQTFAGTIVAADQDLPHDFLMFSLTPDTPNNDNSLFTVTAGGLLSFNNAADFEAPADASRDGVYEVEVAVNDGKGGIATGPITVTVQNIKEPGEFDLSSLNGFNGFRTRWNRRR